MPGGEVGNGSRTLACQMVLQGLLQLTVFHPHLILVSGVSSVEPHLMTSEEYWQVWERGTQPFCLPSVVQTHP